MTSIALAPKTLKFEGGPSKRGFPQEAREKGLLHDDGTRQDRTQPCRYPAHGRLCPDQGSQAPGTGRGQEEPPGGGRSLGDVPFRELRDHVAPDPRNALYREGWRGTDRR